MKKLEYTLAILLAISISFLVGCTKPVAPEYRGVENFRVTALGVGESVVSADLSYYNPNGFKMKLKSGEVSVFVNERFIGKSVLDTATIIPARDSFLIPVSMKVDMKQFYANALDILLNKEVNVRLDGAARLAKGLVGFEVPIKYEGKQKIDIHL